MRLLGAVLYPVVLGDQDGALQAEVVGGQGVGAAAVCVLGGLERPGRGVEDFAEHELVVADARVEVLLARRQEALEVFCKGNS